MYDLIIIGAGPAGIMAAIYAARKRMNFMMVSKDIGGQTALSGDVENYLGYQFITGPDLAVKFKEHLDKFNVELKVGEAATLVQKEGEMIKVQTDKGSYEARTAIVASGRIPRRLGAEKGVQRGRQGLRVERVPDLAAGGPAFLQLGERQGGLAAAALLRPPAQAALERKVARDLAEKGREPLRPVRRDGVPGPAVGVVDAFLRVLRTAQDVERDAAAVGAVFRRGLGERLLRARPEQPDNFAVLHEINPFV